MTDTVPQQWLQKYHPQHLNEVIGNTRIAKQLREWLNQIQQYNSSLTSEKAKQKDDAPIPISFLYGPSGIGKTTLVRTVLDHCNFHVYELNAGCVRSKKRVEDIVEKIMNNQSVSIMKKKHQTIAILMDEVDGMSCGDKGGLHELFNIVQKQKTNGMMIHPVVCISNKGYEKKMAKELCQELSMRRPPDSDIVKRLQYICKCENIKYDDIALQLIVKYGAQDVRRTIHFLQQAVYLRGCDNGKTLCIEDVETVMRMTAKTNYDRNLFCATSDILNKHQSFRTLHHLYKTDETLLPLMIHENIPSLHRQKKLPEEEFITYYSELLHYYSLSDALDAYHTELNYAHVAFFCGYTNELLGKFPNKKSTQEKINFTNTLTKSATQSNTYSILSRMSVRMGMNINQFSKVVPLLLHDIKEHPEHVKLYPINYSDLEKLLQLYNKWWPASKDRSLSLTLKQKTKLKRIINPDF